jgi:hypothetical protein
MAFKVFTRTAWVRTTDPGWPGGIKPGWGRERTLARVATADVARQMCAEWNRTHKPGKLSRKAEFREE